MSNVDRSLSKSSCSVVSPKLSRNVERALSATSKTDRGKRSGKIFQTEYGRRGKNNRKKNLVARAPRGENQCSIPQGMLW